MEGSLNRGLTCTGSHAAVVHPLTCEEDIIPENGRKAARNLEQLLLSEEWIHKQNQMIKSLASRVRAGEDTVVNVPRNEGLATLTQAMFLRR